MPELPEVETVRAGLAPALTNATVIGVDVLDSRSLKRHPGGVVDFQQTMVGAKVLGVVRRGHQLVNRVALQAAKLGRHANKAAALPVGIVGSAGDVDEDAGDALITAAGLRAIAHQPHWWQPAALTPAIATTEGWTFGVV